MCLRSVIRPSGISRPIGEIGQDRGSQARFVEESPMNPGLIPPAEVAAAAKRGLELRAKISPGRHFGRRPSSQGAGRTSAAVAARRGGYERLFRPSRGRQGVEKPRMGRRNRPLCGLYRVALVGRRARPSLGGQFNGAPEQDRGGIIAGCRRPKTRSRMDRVLSFPLASV